MCFKREKSVRYWILLLGLLSSFQLAAVEVSGLYEVDLIANSQSADDRLQVMKQGLFAVLNRVVVIDDIAKLPVVQTMLLNAGQYVKQFQYAALNEQETYSEQAARKVHIEFDEEQILTILQKNQLALWDETRPQTLVWLVVEEDGVQQFYNADTMPDIESAFDLAAKVKGVPMIFPLLDLDDQQAVSVDTVLTMNSSKLLAASARYEVTSVAVAKIAKHGHCWQGSWAFHFDGKVRQWSGLCQPLRASVLAGAQGIYEVLSSYYAARPSTHH